MGPELILFSCFLVKHLIFDWFLQTEYQFANKGNWRHPGGYVHAALNIIGSIFAIVIFVLFFGSIHGTFVLCLLWGEFITHYIMDWSKMNLNKKMGWGPTTHHEFWWLTGFDQFVHLAYLIFMAAILV
jgi:hypothetical protein